MFGKLRLFPKKKKKETNTFFFKVFDTGKIVVTGASSRNDTILASECVRKFFSQSEHLHFKGAILPKEMRYKARIDYRMKSDYDDMEIEFVSVINTKTDSKEGGETKNIQKKQEEEVDNVLDAILNDEMEIEEEEEPDSKKQKTEIVEMPPFIKACLNGQMDMVRFMCSVHGTHSMICEQLDSKGRNALQCMEEDLTEEQQSDDIIRTIMNNLKKTQQSGPAKAGK
jgi:hypothetical protein